MSRTVDVNAELDFIKTTITSVFERTGGGFSVPHEEGYDARKDVEAVRDAAAAILVRAGARPLYGKRGAEAGPSTEEVKAEIEAAKAEREAKGEVPVVVKAETKTVAKAKGK